VIRMLPTALFLVVFASCTASPAPVVETWIVRRASSAEATGPTDGALLVRIAHVDVAAHVKGVTIVRADGEVDHLVYHQWAAPVGEMVESWVRERLQESPRVAAVLGDRDELPPQVRLVLEVRRFEFVEDASGAATAEVELSGSLTGPAFGTELGVVLRGITGRHGVAIAAGEELPVAMSAALHEAVEALAARVDAALP